MKNVEKKDEYGGMTIEQQDDETAMVSILALALIVTAFTPMSKAKAAEDPFSVNAKAAILIEASTGKILFIVKTQIKDCLLQVWQKNDDRVSITRGNC
ncbi:hypothetical protein BsIDN1_00240 [Bacillus safensis]|uniref:Uncharacterized protein n=1 Tax=Bacillus safensis TaxID=561879 RepID=A0A5S9M4I0_BACIA|nr:hypothetical protein BsIDN1_00240 [Bacillus safensis]